MILANNQIKAMRNLKRICNIELNFMQRAHSII